MSQEMTEGAKNIILKNLWVCEMSRNEKCNDGYIRRRYRKNCFVNNLWVQMPREKRECDKLRV